MTTPAVHPCIEILDGLFGGPNWRLTDDEIHINDVYLGDTLAEKDKAAVRLWLYQKWLERAVYMVGSSGSGKTTAMMNIYDRLLFRKTTVLIDFRTDLAGRALFAIVKKGGPEMAEKTYIFDFSRPETLPPFNPVSASCGIADPYSRAANLLESLRSGSSSWGTTIEECGRQALTLAAFNDGSLPMVMKIFLDPAARVRAMDKCPDEYVLDWFRAYHDATEKRQRELSGPFQNKIGHYLVRPEIRMWLSSTQSISFDEILNHQPGAAVVVGLSADSLSPHVASMIGGMVLGTITQIVLARSKIAEGNRVPVRLFCDEFQNFSHLSLFPTLLSEGRRYKCACLLAHQYASQLSTELRQAIVGNAGMQAYFGTDAAQAAVLAPNITSDMSTERVKALLVSQPTGQCILVRRGEKSLRLAVRHYQDPDVSVGDVEAFRQATALKFSAPAAPAAMPVKLARETPVTAAEQAPIQEVFHVQKPDIA